MFGLVKKKYTWNQRQGGYKWLKWKMSLNIGKKKILKRPILYREKGKLLVLELMVLGKTTILNCIMNLLLSNSGLKY